MCYADSFFFLYLNVQHKQTVCTHLCVFLSGQQYSEEFGKISIMRKVPAMKDGSFILTERYNDGLSLGLTSLHLKINNENDI